MSEPRVPGVAPGGAPPVDPSPSPSPTILVVDDDRGVREAIRELLTLADYRVEIFADAETLLAEDRKPAGDCLIVDLRMPGINGLELLARLADEGISLPAVILTGHGDVPTAVEAMRAGVVDFIEKPVRPEQLLVAVRRALRGAEHPLAQSEPASAAVMRLAALSRREREVLDLVIAGHANKEIAARLGIAQRTVETHRANMMKKLRTKSFADLVRKAIAAGLGASLINLRD